MEPADKPIAEANATDSHKSKRAIRSFVIRSGRPTSAQRRALEKYWSNFVIDYQASPMDLGKVFGNTRETVVEIGFGMGDSLLEMAVANPQLNFLGIEVHKAGIGKLLDGLQKAVIDNVKIINHDASEVIVHCFSAASLSKIQIYFPDPWHKKRHHKRRLIQKAFVALLLEKLKPGGQLHLATDWQPYAEHMLEVLGSFRELKNLSGPARYCEQSDRPTTQFEKRGLRLGHGVWDLLFEKAHKNQV
jgi:tRNA (guanine-N7-)-methyltransferase